MSEQALVEVNNGNVPVGSQEKAIYEFRKAELEKFMAMGSTFPEIISTVDGDVCIIEGEEYPIRNETFQAFIVQPGHIQKRPTLKPYREKIFVEYINDGFPTLELIPVGIVRRGRSLFDEEFKEGSDSKPSCYSINGLFPSPRAMRPVCDKCAEITKNYKGEDTLSVTCESGKFKDGKRPECNEYVDVVFLALNLNMAPVRFTFKGKGISAFNKLMDAYKKEKSASAFVKKSVYDSYILMAVDDKGTWVEPKFEIVNAPERNLKKFIPMLNHYLTKVLKEEALRAEQESKPTAETPTIDSKIAAELAAAGNTEVEFVV